LAACVGLRLAHFENPFPLSYIQTSLLEVEMSNAGRNGLNALLECQPGTEYDEDTFLYLLAVERARAERSNRPLRLLFATLEPTPGKPAPIPPASAARLFKGLRLSLRETDVMGWYRQDRVAGAVLSTRADGPGSDMSGLIEQRVGEALRQLLPSRIAGSLRVRVIERVLRQHLPSKVGRSLSVRVIQQ
jgi:hypothetical protein